MTGQDPETLQYFAYIAIVMGIAQIGYGLFQKHSADRAAQNVSLILVWGGIGWFAAAAVCYFGSHIDWIMIPALAAFFGVSGIGSVLYLRSLKSDGNSAGNIVS
jgi:uncharacterized membrane protein HdeD (DUF308 family)